MPSRRIPKSMIEKREVIAWMEANCPLAPTRAANYFMNKRGWIVSPAQVRYWWKDRDEIRQAGPTQLRLSGAGAMPQLDVIEDTLFDLIIQRRVLKLKVSREWIQAKARELAHAEGYEGFMASDKWLSLFMKCYGLSLRRTTNLTVLSDDQLISRTTNASLERSAT